MRTYSRLGALMSLASMAAAAGDNSILIRDMQKATPAPLPPKSPDNPTEQELLAQAKRDRKAARRARLAGY